MKLLILAHFKLYQQRHVISKRSEFGRLISAIGVMTLVELAAAQLLDLPAARAFQLLLAFTSLVALGLGRLAVSSWFQHARASGRMVTPVVVVGDDSSLWRYVQQIGFSASGGYVVVDAINADNLRWPARRRRRPRGRSGLRRGSQGAGCFRRGTRRWRVPSGHHRRAAS